MEMEIEVQPMVVEIAKKQHRSPWIHRSFIIPFPDPFLIEMEIEVQPMAMEITKKQHRLLPTRVWRWIWKNSDRGKSMAVATEMTTILGNDQKTNDGGENVMLLPVGCQ
ncbi:hypothetical protein L6452_02528 [Arctium lappa]|uniref:Uncharacterized protein n=1 Tax=Arctium lappa TaxID=4217 RepID=A0ACB9FKG9_ARCLA|nr:hypothetical protein L6452_02528 [Arctium lappa]